MRQRHLAMDESGRHFSYQTDCYHAYKLSMSSKHFRKRRKRHQDKVVEMRTRSDMRTPSQPKSIRMFCLFISLIFIMNLVSYNCIVESQVILESPKVFKIKRGLPASLTQNSQSLLTLKPGTSTKAQDYNASLSESGFIVDTKQRDELLRSLSSAMLLETLMRKPALKRTFPSLTLHPLLFPGASGSKGAKSGDQNGPTEEGNGVSLDRRKSSASSLDVSTTNLTNSVSVEQPDAEMPPEAKSQANLGESKFNSRSLNHLVEKLLNIKTPVPHGRQQRPARGSSAVIDQHNKTKRTDGNELTSGPASSKPLVTLDMLIRNEFDSRVQPMIKSLKEQRNLSKSHSTRTSTTKAAPNNHRSTSETATSAPQLFYSSASGTSAVPAYENRTTSAETMAVSSTEKTNPTGAPSSDEYEYDNQDDDENDAESDKDDERGTSRSNVATTTTRAPSKKKALRNVPPYQLNAVVGTPNRNLSLDNQSLESKRDTMNNQAESVISASSARSKTHERSNETSSRGSLMFSDGEEEAANKRRIMEMNNVRRPPRRDQDSNNLNGGSTKSSKLGGSFILNQLFSTMNPLKDLDLRSTGYTKAPQRDFTDNPLIYKGYVGKDDYLISTTASDWSRHIGDQRNRANLSGNFYKNLSPSNSLPSITTTTTGAPPTEPPTVPYNYYLNQPVTNAQSVPEMVIPTSDPPDYGATASTRQSSGILKNNSSSFGQRANNSTTEDWPSVYGDSFHSSPSRHLNQGEISDRNYSYQIPDRAASKSDSSQVLNSQIVPTTSLTRFLSGESKSDYKPSATPSPTFNMTTSSWFPTKLNTIDSPGAKSPSVRKKPPGQSQSSMNHTSILLEGTANSSSAPNNKMFPVVEAKSRQQSSGRKQLAVDAGEELVANHGADVSEGSPSSYSHANETTRTTLKRNKSKSTNSKNQPSRVGIQSGASEDGESRPGTSAGVHKVASGAQGVTQSEMATGNEDHQVDGEDEDENQDSSAPDGAGLEEQSESESHAARNATSESAHKATGRTKLREKLLPDGLTNQSGRAHQSQKKKQFVNHETAGSEISASGLDDRGLATNKTDHFPKRKTNQTVTKFIQFQQPSHLDEPIVVDEREQISSNAPPHVIYEGAQAGGATNGLRNYSTIIPNPNFFSEASSERPVLDNSIHLLNVKAANHHGAGALDPYQKTSSNTILSTIMQPFSTTTSPFSTTTGLKSTTQAGAKDHHEESNASSNQSGVNTNKNAPKSSNDRLAFILIGGSCVLSVVCLVLAAMSMRCQDVCDDYQSLRNAEKAALKLQKHRLKYMKNHQIDRFNGANGLSSGESGQSLIDDANLDNVNNSSLEVELSNARNARNQNLNANKSILCRNNTEWSGQNNCRMNAPAFLNGQLCVCENCAARRMVQDDLNSKHLSWIHPYFYMQGHSRLRPLFGAGSSVGTFFPKRHEDQSLRASSSAGAQIHFDNQPGHHCLGVGAAHDMTRSKSILSRTNNNNNNSNNLNNLVSNKHVNVFESSCSAAGANHECAHADLGHHHAYHSSSNNNSNNNHHHHLHHQHHAHKCHHHKNETSASDESELTTEEPTCGNLHCYGDHHANNRIKLTHLAKLNNQLSSGLFKQLSDQVRVTNQRGKGNTFQHQHAHHGNHHHHHHHHQQQQQQQQHNHRHAQQQLTTSSDSSSPAQCTCSRDHQPLIAANRLHSPNRTNHKRLASSHDHRAASKHQTKRDKSMFVWSTNRDRLI